MNGRRTDEVRPERDRTGVIDGRIPLGMDMVSNLHACYMIIASFPRLCGIFFFNAVAGLPFFGG